MAKTPIPLNISEDLEVISFFNILAEKTGRIDSNGAFQPPILTDANASNNTVYYSSTQSKLVYKDTAGVVNNLY